ncbi:MAG: phosphoribosylanthranilate isomerase [Abditibacteriota bacterium]|nr:phosphoribosylanthranilate isomerase [Abditibacteriota bacterium]
MPTTSSPIHAPQIKICGTTSIQDAQLAEEAGADFLGIIIEHAPSPRNVSREQARLIAASISIPVVAVTVNKSSEGLLRLHDELHPHAIQLHGDETPQLVRELVRHGLRVWVAVSGERAAVLSRAQEMREAGAETLVIDARLTTAQGVIYGGSGHLSDWEAARLLVEAGARINLAGGLSPDNVREAIATVQPHIVDVASGIEAAKGVKNRDKVLSFVRAAQKV